MPINDKSTKEFYVGLGFVDLIPPLADSSTTITMCRSF